MSVTKKSLILFFILSAIVCFALIFQGCFFSSRDKVDCTATVKWADYQKKKEFIGTIVFDLESEKAGAIDILGLLIDEQNNETYHVRRVIKLHSKIENNSKIFISIDGVQTHLSDTAPDDLFNKYVIDTSARTLFLGVKRFYNAHIISTPYTAAIMCVNKD